MFPDPFEPIRKDARRIKAALTPSTFPVTKQVGSRTIRIEQYPSRYHPEVGMGNFRTLKARDEKRRIVGQLDFEVRPEEGEVKFRWLSIVLREVGIGRAMVKSLEDDLRAKGYWYIELLAVPDSIPFWKKMGYTPKAEEVPGESLQMEKLL